jgi:hypothetical protein
MMADPEELLVKITSGRELEAEEFAEMISLLELKDRTELGRKLSHDDLYSLLVVLGKTGRKDQRGILERYLDIEDPLTVSLVLEILCLDWGYLDDQLERLMSFALGNSWDGDDDVRLMAIKLLGEYLHGFLRTGRKAPTETERKRMTSINDLLLNLFQDESLDRQVRQGAYFALLRGAGKEWDEIPSEYARLDLAPGSKDILWELLPQG